MLVSWPDNARSLLMSVDPPKHPGIRIWPLKLYTLRTTTWSIWTCSSPNKRSLGQLCFSLHLQLHQLRHSCTLRHLHLKSSKWATWKCSKLGWIHQKQTSKWHAALENGTPVLGDSIALSHCFQTSYQRPVPATGLENKNSNREPQGKQKQHVTMTVTMVQSVQKDSAAKTTRVQGGSACPVFLLKVLHTSLNLEDSPHITTTRVQQRTVKKSSPTWPEWDWIEGHIKRFVWSRILKRPPNIMSDPLAAASSRARICRTRFLPRTHQPRPVLSAMMEELLHRWERWSDKKMHIAHQGKSCCGCCEEWDLPEHLTRSEPSQDFRTKLRWTQGFHQDFQQYHEARLVDSSWCCKRTEQTRRPANRNSLDNSNLLLLPEAMTQFPYCRACVETLLL